MQAGREGREGLILELYLMEGKAEGNRLMRPEPAEEERGRHQDSSFSSTMALVVKDVIGTTGPGTQLWLLAVHPGCILAVLRGSHPPSLFGRKPGTNDPVRTRLRYYLISSHLQSGFLLKVEKKLL